MKRVILFALMVLFGANLAAQKPFRKESRAAEKTKKLRIDSLLNNQAWDALVNGNFVLEANRLMFKRGETASVSANTNFISRSGDEAFVQVAFHTVVGGPNGIGGITVRGSVSDIRLKRDKRGSVHYSMQVLGVGISARVDITLFGGGNRASAVVTPNFNSNRVTLEGELIPTDLSTVYKGRVR